MNRFQKKEFKNFQNGLGYDFSTENSFQISDGINIQEETKKMELAKSITSVNLAGFHMAGNHTTEVFNGNIYVIQNSSALGVDIQIYKSTNDGVSFSLFQTIVGGGESISLFEINNRLFATMDTLGLYILDETETSFSAVGGDSVNHTYFWGRNAFAMGDDGYIYFADIDPSALYSYIWKTNDYFTTSELVYTFSGEYDIESLVFFQGFIYGHIDKKFFRLTNTGPEFIRHFTHIPYFTKQDDDLLFIFTKAENDTNIYEFDGTEIKQIKKLKNFKQHSTMSPARFFSDDKVYFSAIDTITNLYTIFAIDKNGAIFKHSKLDTSYSANGIRKVNDTIIIATVPSVGYDDRIYRNGVFVTSGTLDTGIINEGKIVPIAVILRHKPLVAGVSVKLYIKKENASSWGSSVLTDDIDGDVERQYDFPNTYGKVTFLELRAELLTSDTSKTPENVEMVFLYKPVGIEVSQ